MRSRRRWALAACGTALLGLSVWLGLGLHEQLIVPRPSTLIIDRHGSYLGEVSGDDDAPERIARATLETEDRRFYDHGGVSFLSILRALWQNARSLKVVSGASTISMQVARMQDPGSRGLFRKLREGLEAQLLVHAFGHEAVLRDYLTVAPYGNRVRGAVRAARLYFGKPLEDLSWLQAAYLAGLPQAPGRMNPYEPEGRGRGLDRAKRILARLHAVGALSEAELREALGSQLGIVPLPHRPNDALHAALAWGRRPRATWQPIETATLDLDMQTKVAEILSRRLGQLRGAGSINGSALVVDSESGDILAYVGSRDYFSPDDHGAVDFVQTKRSPGSALKPFIYALGLEQGRFTAASLLADTPVDIQTEGREAYLPENINHGFLGPMLFREALANSRNIPALRVLSEVGVEPTLRLLARSGIAGISFEPDRYGLGLAIGNLPVSLAELVSSYGLFAHDGQKLPLRWFDDDSKLPPERLLRPEVAEQVRQILSDPLARRPSFKMGSTLDYPYAVAIKTGTSQGYRDSWAVALSDRLLVGLWIGAPDWKRTDHVTGAGGPAPAVHQILDALMPGYQPYRSRAQTFPPPASYVTRVICPISGKLAGPDCPDSKVEAFAPGTEPYESCPFHQRVRLDRRNGLRAGPNCPAATVEMRPMLALPHSFERWARLHHLEMAPRRESPLCPSGPEEGNASITIEEPQDNARFLRDPDAPPSEAAIRLSAEVKPADEQIVWIVDGVPVEEVGYPFESRWALTPGKHVITAAMLRRQAVSRSVRVYVQN
jgi:penicillin-binding protein 1C